MRSLFRILVRPFATRTKNLTAFCVKLSSIYAAVYELLQNDTPLVTPNGNLQNWMN